MSETPFGNGPVESSPVTPSSPDRILGWEGDISLETGDALPGRAMPETEPAELPDSHLFSEFNGGTKFIDF